MKKKIIIRIGINIETLLALMQNRIGRGKNITDIKICFKKEIQKNSLKKTYKVFLIKNCDGSE